MGHKIGEEGGPSHSISSAWSPLNMWEHRCPHLCDSDIPSHKHASPGLLKWQDRVCPPAALPSGQPYQLEWPSLHLVVGRPGFARGLLRACTWPTPDPSWNKQHEGNDENLQNSPSCSLIDLENHFAVQPFPEREVICLRSHSRSVTKLDLIPREDLFLCILLLKIY